MRLLASKALRALCPLAFVVASVATAWAQAQPNINLTRVRYNTLKATTKPDGELKAHIDQIDRELAEATRMGRTGEMRRLFAKGTALLNGRPWTDVEEFDASLILRTNHVVLDSSQPQTVRLEQFFAPQIALTQPLTATVTIGAATSLSAEARPSNASRAKVDATLPAVARVESPTRAEVGRFDNIPRDLRESPFLMDLDLSGVADGTHVLDVEVKDAERSLGSVSLRLAVLKGLDARLRQLDASAATAPADIRADLRYPADYIRKVNRGVVELGAFNVATELAAAEKIASEAKGGKNPFTGRTGGFERHYTLEAAGEIMPYRVYVPTTYNASRPYPLIVALHGLGATEDSMMDMYEKVVPTLAEQRGYIVVAPLGFRVDGFYGFSLSTDANPGDRRRVELSELDVMEVLKRVRSDYKIDDSRIYLMGHSMGAIGTWSIAAKHPTIWAALAPFSGLGNTATMEEMRHISQIVVHGDADPTVSVTASRAMVAEMKKLGVDHVYIEVPSGNHTDIVAPNMSKVFDFFDQKRKAGPTTQ
jgi:poly(3-hydroxybutyrate) depolymerase